MALPSRQKAAPARSAPARPLSTCCCSWCSPLAISSRSARLINRAPTVAKASWFELLNMATPTFNEVDMHQSRPAFEDKGKLPRRTDRRTPGLHVVLLVQGRHLKRRTFSGPSNALIDGDIVYHGYADIGVLLFQRPEGLAGPVLRNAQLMSLG
ncbi:hypothetical protein ACXX9E_29675 [Pseudomonas sp. GNP014]